MMLSDVVIQKLYKNKSSCVADAFNEKGNLNCFKQSDYAIYQKAYGIQNKSAFVDFYLTTFLPPVGQCEELLTEDGLDEQIQYDLDDEELPEGVGTRFIRFTSSGYSHSYFFDTVTDVVYDIEWGQEQDMVDGKLTPTFNSFGDFLTWYYS